MKLIPIGIYSDAGKQPPSMRASDFSTDRFEGVELRADRKHDPVVIMKSRQDDPLNWKVVYGFSTVFFRSFAEAVEFCNSRGFRLMKEQVE